MIKMGMQICRKVNPVIFTNKDYKERKLTKKLTKKAAMKPVRTLGQILTSPKTHTTLRKKLA